MAEDRAPRGPRRGPGPGASMKDVGKVWPTLKRVLAYTLSHNKFKCLVVLICILLGAFIQIMGTMFMKTLIDDFIVPMVNTGSTDFSPLFHKLCQLACCFAVGIICAYSHQRIMVSVTQNTLYRLREEVFTNMESLPIGYFDSHAHGDIMSVYTNDIDTLRQMISQTLPQCINSMVTIVMALVSMIILNIPLTILLLIMVAIMIGCAGKLGGLSSKYFIKQQMSLGKLDGYIEEMMGGQKVVKVFNHEEKSIEEFTKLNDEFCEASTAAHKFANMLMPVNAQLGHLAYVLCAVVGAAFALGGVFGLTLGALVSFLQLSRNFTMPITQLSMQLSAVVMAQAGATRVFDLMDQKSEVDEGKVTLVNVEIAEDGTMTETSRRTEKWAWKKVEEDGTVTLVKLEGDVKFKDVDFSYVPEKQILYDINMFAEPGQKIAFVGSTGAGKTTITNLINRFYEIQGGQILYDGIDVVDIKKDDLRKSLGIVLQDTHLFTETVMENIRYGRLDATDEECIAAAKLANADGFIRRLPDGYNTMLTGDGANLSQGQRQLLAIARAAVADPPVLILDEATSSIDTRTEMLVQAGMDALMADRTTFVIAHRLSTVKNSDCIMVIEAGHIIERGNHDQLIEEKGRYYQLYTGNAIAEGL